MLEAKEMLKLNSLAIALWKWILPKLIQEIVEDEIFNSEIVCLKKQFRKIYIFTVIITKEFYELIL